MSPTRFIFFVALAVSAVAADGRTSNVQQEGAVPVQPEYGWRRPPFPSPWWPSSPPPPPPSPTPPPPDSWWCNRTYGEEAVSITDEVDCPPPPAPPTTPTPATSCCPWPCWCPRWPRPTRVVTTDSATTDDGECHEHLAVVSSCVAFVSGDADDIPTVTSGCCAGLRSILNKTSRAADTAAGDGVPLECACKLLLGDAQATFPKTVDVERTLYLPVACSVSLPPYLIYYCSTGRVAPPVVRSSSESEVGP